MRPSKALLNKWYKKLRDSGFEDIEEPHQDYLKKWHKYVFTRGAKHRNDKNKAHNDHPTRLLAVQRYYQLASEVLNNFKFDNELERRIWEMHCEGLGVRRIGWAVGINKDYVHRIVRRIQQATCLKK